jgi:50S ribosomal subunit-associated GTPase HflX
MSALEKYEANLSAIRALRRIETEKREATETERVALSRYTGWGDTEVRQGLRRVVRHGEDDTRREGGESTIFCSILSRKVGKCRPL